MNALRARPALLLYISLTFLGVVTYFGGSHGIGAIRLVYLFGCVAIGFQALHFGTAYHFEALVVQFAFSPYLRRIVDYGCGFDAHGYMLTGPLLAALLPAMDLPTAVMAARGHLVGRLAPYLLIFIALGYAALLSILGGDYTSAITGFGKSGSVLLYGCCLLAKAEDPQQLMRQGARAFAVVMPIVGIYGVMQYFNPSPADSYWMTSTAMSSIGLPEPEKVRVFSTLNSPASLGNFLVFALMFVAFFGSRWQLLTCFAPGTVALLLSQFRTAWLALASSIIYAIFFSATKTRSLVLVVAIISVSTIAISATSLGDVISARLQTISNDPGDDGSARARLDELVFIFSHLDNYLLGSGTGFPPGKGTEFSTQTTGEFDGMIVTAISSMGIFFGGIFILGVIWAGLQALQRVNQNSPSEYVVAAALVVGQLLTIPLNNPTIAEFGVFYWMVVAVAMRAAPASQVFGRGTGAIFVQELRR